LLHAPILRRFTAPVIVSQRWVGYNGRLVGTLRMGALQSLGPKRCEMSDQEVVKPFRLTALSSCAG